MNKYIMLNHRAGSTKDWDAYFKMLRDGGHMVGGSALDHGISVKDGIFGAPQSGSVAGYIVIQAEDIEAAKKIAAQSPVHQAGGTVDLFTLIQT